MKDVRTIGILGGGQLGRMSILAGRRLGLRFHVFEPSADCTGGRVADRVFDAPYDDVKALEDFAKSIDVATLEFENVPKEAAGAVSSWVPLLPSAHVLSVCQHRQREKSYLKQAGLPCARFEVAKGPEELPVALAAIGGPAVVKTAAFGYDGKGQVMVDDANVDPEALWQKLNRPPAVVVEERIRFQCEVSVVVARDRDGRTECFPMSENLHRNHVLHMSIVPARVPDGVEARAQELASRLAADLDVVGLIGVEMFYTEDDRLLVNEMAPRPHNSGHYTLDATTISQFEQHVRAVAGWPLAKPELLRPTVMVNLLGDLWAGGVPDFRKLLTDSTVFLHDYDKGEARPGRKMGHFTVLDTDRDRALERAQAHFDALNGSS